MRFRLTSIRWTIVLAVLAVAAVQASAATRYTSPTGAGAEPLHLDVLHALDEVAVVTNGSSKFARPPRIVLRSSWQTVNIGDIGHTPGTLRLLEEHLPDAQVTLWAMKLDERVTAMLQARFPRVRILQGKLDGQTERDEALRRAISENGGVRRTMRNGIPVMLVGDEQAVIDPEKIRRCLEEEGL